MEENPAFRNREKSRALDRAKIFRWKTQRREQNRRNANPDRENEERWVEHKSIPLCGPSTG